MPKQEASRVILVLLQTAARLLSVSLILVPVTAFAQNELASGYIIKAKEGANLPPSAARIKRVENLPQSDVALMVSSDVSICDQLKDSVEYCEPNFPITIAAIPNDPAFHSMWALNNSRDVDIDAPQAWDISTGNAQSVVAILDTGVDYNHPDLRSNIFSNPGEIESNGVDDDGNGYVDDVHGINLVTGSGDPYDDNLHGTHVAGIIGATGGNQVGVIGVNWQVKMIAVKFLDNHGGGTTYDAIRGIDYIINLKNNFGIPVGVINASWGSPNYSRGLEDAIGRANAAGILFIAAAGNVANNNDSLQYYPAGYNQPNVISVAASDNSGNLASFSNYGGTTVDIAAPGVAIYSTVPGNGYALLSGTSMATPFVAGAATLVHAVAPGLTALEIRDRILTSGHELNSLRSLISSGSLLNLNNLLSGRITSRLNNPNPHVVLPSGIAISASSRTLIAGKNYRFMLTGSVGQSVRPRFIVAGRSCSLGNLAFRRSSIDLRLKVPNSNLSGGIYLDATDQSGGKAPRIKLRLQPVKSQNRSLAKSVEAISKVSAKVKRTWCRRVQRSIVVR